MIFTHAHVEGCAVCLTEYQNVTFRPSIRKEETYEVDNMATVAFPIVAFHFVGAVYGCIVCKILFPLAVVAFYAVLMDFVYRIWQHSCPEVAFAPPAHDSSTARFLRSLHWPWRFAGSLRGLHND